MLKTESGEVQVDDVRRGGRGKAVSAVVVSWLSVGVRRYRAWFKPNPRRANRTRVSNKERFDEGGTLEAVNIFIPNAIFAMMVKKAAAIIFERH